MHQAFTTISESSAFVDSLLHEKFLKSAVVSNFTAKLFFQQALMELRGVRWGGSCPGAKEMQFKYTGTIHTRRRMERQEQDHRLDFGAYLFADWKSWSIF